MDALCSVDLDSDVDMERDGDDEEEDDEVKEHEEETDEEEEEEEEEDEDEEQDEDEDDGKEPRTIGQGETVNPSADDVDPMADNEPIFLLWHGQEMREDTPQPRAPAPAPGPETPEPRPRPRTPETHPLSGLKFLGVVTPQKPRPVVPTLREAEAA